jgi:hypothetical protein
LRVLGWDWESIAEETSYSNVSNCRRAVQRFCGSIPQPDLVEVRAEMAEVLRYARRRAVEAVELGKAGSIRDLIAVEARAAALYGADQPSEMIVHTPTATEVEQWVATMTSRSMPSLALVEYDVVGDEVIDVTGYETAPAFPEEE